jgi:aspartyl-tRNA(Asn)/glutamyl-tRNA(Gln) amidotransferase subunit C
MERERIQPGDVARIAELAHLALSDEESAKMADELGAILGYVRTLEELDVSAVPPTAHVRTTRGSALRADETRPSLPVEVALAEAPKTLEDGFAVPAFVDEG